MVEGVVEVKGSGLGEGSGLAMSWLRGGSYTVKDIVWSCDNNDNDKKGIMGND